MRFLSTADIVDGENRSRTNGAVLTLSGAADYSHVQIIVNIVSAGFYHV